MLVMLVFIKPIHIEPIDFGFIGQILHPEHPKGALLYDPMHHHNYIVAAVAAWTGGKDNLANIARIFWFIEMGAAILILISLVNLIFKNDKMTLVILIMMFMLSKSGEIDQKTMAMPLYLLAIYYF